MRYVEQLALRQRPRPDAGIRGGEVSFEPSLSLVRLFDHLVGAGEQGRREGDAKGLRRLEVQNEIEPGRLLDREVPRILALEHPAGVNAGLTVYGLGIGSIAQASSRNGCIIGIEYRAASIMI
jgi:hypothetical protein